MDYKFNYSLDKNDLINFELFKIKSSKFMSMIYITVLIMLVMNTYYAFSEKNYAYLLIPALYIVAIGIYLFYIKKIRPDMRVKRCIKADVTYSEPREVTISEKSIEFKTLPKNEGEPMLIGFYPYLTLGAIIETKEYIYFIATTGTNIVPKSIIPQEIKENVLKIIKKNPNYLFFNKN